MAVPVVADSIGQQMLRFIQNPDNTFAEHTQQTLIMSIVPILLSVVIALPLGVATARRPIAAALSIWLSGIFRAVPALVFLAVMLPVLGIGLVPSIVALTLIGIPPILLNVIAGLRGVDPASIEAARGMGMTRQQILLRVEMPLVLPVVAAGVRSAAVQVVATTPVAALIGGGGYGDYILAGINLFDFAQAAVGAVAIALLALLTELLFALAQRLVTPAGVRVGERVGELVA